MTIRKMELSAGNGSVKDVGPLRKAGRSLYAPKNTPFKKYRVATKIRYVDDPGNPVIKDHDISGTSPADAISNLKKILNSGSRRIKSWTIGPAKLIKE
jgi:hypothetical protein